MSWWDDIIAVVEGTNDVASGQGTNVVPDVAGAVTGTGSFTGFIESIETFMTALTDGKMYRSLAWIFLGSFMVITGLVLLLRKPLAELGGAAARGAML